MFCKLFKYDCKDLFQKAWIMYFFLLVTALIVRICRILTDKIPFLDYLADGGSALLIIASVAIFVWIFLIGMRHFYQKMLTDEGYLTNTLPAKSSTIMISKTLSMILMMLVTIAVIVLSLMLAMYDKESWTAIWEMAKQSLAVDGVNIGYFLTFMLSICALNMLTIQLVVQCSLMMGHSFSQNKMGYSIGYGFVFYIAYQILNVIGLGILFLSKPNFIQLMETEALLPNEVITPVFIIVATTLSILSIVSIVLTHYFAKKKLNLE